MRIGHLITILLIVFFLVVPRPARGVEWKEKSLPHFKVLYVSQDEHYATELHEALEEIRARIIADIGEVGHRPVEIYIVPSHEQMWALQPPGGDVPPWAAAAAFWERNLILIRSPRLLRGKRKDVVETAAHEVAHVLLGRAVGEGFQIPRWLNEGFAMYEAREWNAWDTGAMMWASATSSFFPFEDLTEDFPAGEQDARVAYLQSISMVSYLLDNYGREGFISFIRGLREHRNLNYSLKLNYELTMKELEKRWVKKVRLTYSWIPIGTGASTLWFLFTWLLVVGYIRKRAEARRKLRIWEKEEAEGRWTDFE